MYKSLYFVVLLSSVDDAYELPSDSPDPAGFSTGSPAIGRTYASGGFLLSFAGF